MSWGWSPHKWDWCPYKRDPILAPFCHVRFQEDDWLWTASRSSPDIKAVGDTKSVSDLVLTFSPPELWEICVCCLSHSVHDIFIVAARTDRDTRHEKAVTIGRGKEDRFHSVLLKLKIYFKTYPIEKIMYDLYWYFRYYSIWRLKITNIQYVCVCVCVCVYLRIAHSKFKNTQAIIIKLAYIVYQYF